jgi:hypothetical protein
MSGAQQVESIKATVSPQYASVYANNVAVTSNFFDTSMVFSEMLGIQDGALSLEQRVRVVMALSQVKILAWTLLQQVGAYEKEFGKIRLSSKVVPPELAGFLELDQNEHES